MNNYKYQYKTESSSIILPHIPQYDKELYPYSFITYDEGFQAFWFTAISAEGNVVKDGDSYTYNHPEDKWELKSITFVILKNINSLDEDLLVLLKHFYGVVSETRWSSGHEDAIGNKAISLHNEIKWVSKDIDIKDTSGQVVSSISHYTPIKNFSLEDFLTGIVIGICEEPVNLFKSYSRLIPKISNYDKEEYPHQVIIRTAKPSIFQVVLTTTPLYLKDRVYYFGEAQDIELKYRLGIIVGKTAYWGSDKMFEKDQKFPYQNIIYSDYDIISKETIEINGIDIPKEIFPKSEIYVY